MSVTGFDNKPTGYHVAQQNNETARNVYYDLTPDEFKEKIEHGISFIPSVIDRVYKGAIKRIEQCWSYQGLFVLDFDDGEDDVSVLNKCNKLKLNLLQIYPSFSHTSTKPKFRVIFRVANPVTNLAVAKLIQLALMTIFENCDQSCKDNCRIFFGTKYKSTYFEPANTLDIAMLFDQFDYKLTGNKNRDRIIKRICKLTGIAMVNKRLAVTKNKELLEEAGLDIVEHNGLYFGFCNSSITDTETNEPSEEKSINKRSLTTNIAIRNSYQTIDNFDFGKLYERCQLWQMFCDEKEKVEYHQLVRLAMNLMHVKGGAKKLIKTLDKIMTNNPTLYDTSKEDKLQKVDAIIAGFRQQNYQPASCGATSYLEACPFCEACQHGANMLVTAEVQKNEIVKLSQTMQSSINDIKIAEAKLNCLITSAYGKQGIHFIQAPVGLGKTEEYLKIVQPLDVIATPNHDLCQEICQSLDKLGKEYAYLSARPPLLDADQKCYEIWLKVGAIQKAKSFYYEMVNQYKNNPHLCQAYNNTIQNCEQFIALEQDIEKTNKIIVCTHDKLPFVLDVNPNIKNVFLDESIDDTLLFKIHSVKRCDIETVLKILRNSKVNIKMISELEALIDSVDCGINRNDAVIRKQLQISSEEKQLILDSIKPYLNRFSSAVSAILDNSLVIVPNYEGKTPDGMAVCNTLSVVKDNANFFKQYPLVNFINVSATFHEGIIRQLFGQAVQTVDYINESNQIRLYHTNTCSKQNIKKLLKDNEWIDYVKKVAGNMPVITFKTLKEDLKGLGLNVVNEMHYWKCIGKNQLAGQDMTIIGTPHSNEHKYLCLGAVLGYDISNTQKNKQEVEYNGYRFNFYTYTNNNFLRELQLYCIDSQLTQAVGRARTIRTDAVVHVFSNFPVQGATLMEMGEVK